MKIGILTQPLSRNYGGILQAWALQQVLKQYGHQPVTVFRKYDANLKNPLLRIRRIFAFAKSLILRYFWGDKKRFITSPFKQFFDCEGPEYCDEKFIDTLDHTDCLYSDNQLHKEIIKYNFDAFIVGSDQVWREACSPRIETYFLDFLDSDDSRKKIAYAASFGTESDYISENRLPQCKELIKRFDAISLREDGGLKIAWNLFGRTDAIKVLDPTLLLSQDYYNSLIKKADRNIGSTYIAAYILDNTEEKNLILYDISSQLNLDIHHITTEYKGIPMPTISQWIANIADSSFVVTDSFHGCVFSIIFQKPFIVIGNAVRGLDRFTSLLSMLGLEERMISNKDDFDSRKEKLITSFDYSNVNTKLAEMRKLSYNFLDNALA